MPIRKNADGRTSTVVRTDSTGTNRGGGTPIAKRSLAKGNTSSPKIIDKSQELTPRKQR